MLAATPKSMISQAAMGIDRSRRVHLSCGVSSPVSGTLNQQILLKKGSVRYR
jgi:hypothetical protein